MAIFRQYYNAMWAVILFYQQRVNSLTLATLSARNSIWQSEKSSDKRNQRQKQFHVHHLLDSLLLTQS